MKINKRAKEAGAESKEPLEKAKGKKPVVPAKGKPALYRSGAGPAPRAKSAVKVKEKPAAPVTPPKATAPKAPAPKAAPPPPPKETAVSELIEKIAKPEKDIRALHPQELEEKTTETETKEKRRIKVFSKSGFIPTVALPERPLPPPVKHGVPTAPVPSRPGAGPVLYRSGAGPVRPVVAKPPLARKAPAERSLVVESPVTIKALSEKMGIRANQIIQRLMNHNLMKTINESLDEDTLILIGLEFNYNIELKKPKDIMDEAFKGETDKPGDLVPRPPVVVIMGHVDHGKTSLLDKIRGTNVAAGEAGLITQHLGAYQVTINGRKITFLDTPGHEAFTNMRARGANITDIAVLVVAADDGVMPQTEEAINHIKAANVAMIVAINKVDKKDANIIRVKQQLAALELNPEEWGGKTIFAEVSALTGQGIDHLLEMLLLQAEILELKANPKRPASGTVLEARLNDNLGPWATVLVQNGTLHVGDAVVCGVAYGKIRAMYDDRKKPITAAPPAMPVGITGLVAVPESGDRLVAVPDVKIAKEIAESVARQTDKGPAAGPSRHITMESLFGQIEEKKLEEVRIILKVDMKGSLEVLNNLIGASGIQEVHIKIIHSGVGAITESDVILADASDAIVIGFNVGVDDRTKTLAQERGIQIKTYSIIYQIMEDIKLALQGLLVPEKVEVVTAHMVVRQLFKISRLGTIAGGQILDGTIKRSNLVRVKRGKDVVFSGKLASLKRFKDDVGEVAQGFECGLRIDGFDKVQAGDIVESYVIEERSRKLI